MVVWCENCNRFVNQHCDTCGENFGVLKCEKYACGGTMICPVCGGSNLIAKKEVGPDRYEYYNPTIQDQVKQIEATAPPVAPVRTAGAGGAKKCLLCGFPVEPTWKYCPECGVSFRRR